MLFSLSRLLLTLILFFFFFNDTATTEIYTLSLHDALPILARAPGNRHPVPGARGAARGRRARHARERSEEHTSELQSHSDLVCRLLLEKKKKSSSIADEMRRTSIFSRL